ncbi:6-carboxytetrahydropterin synthase [Hydrogenophaga intermedia]|jgi:6-pyruvoyltetrahydropterin/6-carboxytetrahydropterin synthase|uniref:6-carboxytetrahydropterin synthase n=1 Tax=Hydrogenophaga intermedia TaxID=65786 RepID=UPI0020449D54|nr:6-carboxytetrahydropterin synthase [Hydrogenophaga intermedia]MCM3564748.1 6-carboxytetrahydropterin synthase [Hydrogenophaga intermedia]
MTFEISQSFFFDAAHTLQREIGCEGSARVHGHTYRGEVSVTGAVDPHTGMVIDLGQLRLLVAQLREHLDHRLLDEVPGLGIPTLENLCAFIVQLAVLSDVRLSRVSVWREGIGDRCDFRFE